MGDMVKLNELSLKRRDHQQAKDAVAPYTRPVRAVLWEVGKVIQLSLLPDYLHK